MNWKNRRVLVTGGAGFIGSHLVQALVEKGAHVSVADNLWRGKLDNLKNEKGVDLIDIHQDFLNADLTQYDACRAAAKEKEMIFHLADVVAGINYVFGNELSLFNSNLLINTNMLHAAVECSVKDFIYVGTACSYPKEKQDKLNVPLLKEDDVYPANPESSYGWSKLMGEYECALAMREKLINIGVLRLHNVYGPKTDFSPEKSQVIPSLIRKAIRHPKEEFIVWGSGEQRRAFIYVDDVVKALMLTAEKGMNQGAIQIGPDYSTSIREIAETVVSISKKDIPIIYDPSKPEGDKDRAADWSKAKKILGWNPETTITDGLRRSYNWFKEKIE
ncbi:MAG: NAD-dependent epimerase/dehydratase family protein [Thermodesulfobacteriota bacterium]